jgi:hypothetical protein
LQTAPRPERGVFVMQVTLLSRVLLLDKHLTGQHLMDAIAGLDSLADSASRIIGDVGVPAIDG